MPGCSARLLTGTDHHQTHLTIRKTLHLNLMAVTTQSGNNHLFRLTRIKIHLKALADAHALQREPTADEIERTGRPTEIELTIGGTVGHGHRWPNSLANKPLLW